MRGVAPGRVCCVDKVDRAGGKNEEKKIKKWSARCADSWAHIVCRVSPKNTRQTFFIFYLFEFE